MEDRQVKQVLSKDWYQWEREDITKGFRRANMVDILCTQT
jgi:hypothetical protein